MLFNNLKKIEENNNNNKKKFAKIFPEIYLFLFWKNRNKEVQLFYHWIIQPNWITKLKSKFGLLYLDHKIWVLCSPLQSLELSTLSLQ